MSINPQHIALLRQLVEESADHPIVTSNDFIFLSGEIRERLNENLSASTLKRLWGYVDGYASVRSSTLNILSRFVGYPDWETFVSDYCEVDGVQSSHRVMSESLYADDLPEGSCLEVTWNPNRRCVFRYFGNRDFEVTESQNAKLKPGVRFTCERFTLHQSLFVHVHNPNGETDLFVMGNKGGLTKICKKKG